MDCLGDKTQASIIKRISTYCLIFSFLTITFALLSIEKVVSYEISIYDDSLSFFIFMTLSNIISIIVLLVSIVHRQKRGIFYSLMAILIVELILFLMPFLKGYEFYGRGDALTHMAFIYRTLDSGNILSANFYPMSHILTSEIALVFNVVPSDMYLLNMCTATFFAVISILLLGGFAYKATRCYITASIAVLIYIFILRFLSPNYVMPSFFSILLLITFSHLAITKLSSKSAVCLGIVSITIIYSHPLTGAFLIALLFILMAYSVFFTDSNEKIFENKPSRHFGYLLLPLMAIFLLWFLESPIFRKTIEQLLSFINKSTVRPVILGSGSLSLIEGLSLFDLLILATFWIGLPLIYLTIALVSRAWYYVGGKKNHSQKKGNMPTMVVFGIYVGIFIWVLNVIGLIPITMTRSLIYPLVFSTIIVAAIISSHCKTITMVSPWKTITSIGPCIVKKKKFAVCLLLFFVLSSIINLYSFYPSSLSQMPNEQLTSSDLVGISYASSYLDGNDNIYSILYISRLLSTYNGLHTYNHIISTDHFGYSNQEGGNELSSGDYVIYSASEQMIYVEGAWSTAERFTDADFIHLTMDGEMSSLYTNSFIFMMQKEIL